MAAAEAVKAFEWRVFEKLLKSKQRNASFRRKTIRKLLTELVEKERVETTLARAQDVARVANRMIDLAKENNEPIVFTWLMRKALVPKVCEILVPRYSGSKEPYTRVYKMPPNAVDKFPMGIVEFLHNNLPPLEPSEDELVKFKREFLLEKLESKLSHEGFLV